MYHKEDKAVWKRIVYYYLYKKEEKRSYLCIKYLWRSKPKTENTIYLWKRGTRKLKDKCGKHFTVKSFSQIRNFKIWNILLIQNNNNIEI